MSTTLPYRTEIDEDGCERCGSSQTWTVVGPDETSESQSWGQFDDADHFADRMNAAYIQGLRSAVQIAELGRGNNSPGAQRDRTTHWIIEKINERADELATKRVTDSN